jgi:hypothetical protein
VLTKDVGSRESMNENQLANDDQDSDVVSAQKEREDIFFRNNSSCFRNNFKSRHPVLVTERNSQSLSILCCSDHIR